ncbi:MAG TPA: oligosaccharide flippase family protein [Candidatus Methanoperedens sp.]
MDLIRLLRGNELLKHSSILFTASIIAGFLNYLFQLYVGRMLGPSDYGIYSSLVALLYIMSVPSSTIQTSVAKLVSDYGAEHKKIKYLLNYVLRKLTLIAVLASALFLIVSIYLADFLRINSGTYFFILSTVLFISFLAPVLIGALQGMQMFVQMGINNVAGTLFKLLSGVILVYFGFGVVGALIALFIGSLVAMLHALIPLRFLKGSKEVDGNIRLLNYSMAVMFATIGLTFLPNADLLLVKHYLSDSEAGYYAAAAILGKIVLFATGPIAMVMFPKATLMNNKNLNGTKLLRNSLLYIGGVSLLIVTVFMLIPEFIVRSLFGSRFLEINELLVFFAAAMAFFSLANAVVFYDLATQKYRFLYVLGIISGLEVVLVGLFHDSSLTVVRILTLLMAIMFIGVWFCEKR